jgi:GTP-binding protein HflX
VFNKMDALPEDQREALTSRIANLAPDSLFVSAVTEGGLEPMRDALRETLRNRRPEVELLIPMTDGKLLSEAHRAGEILATEADQDEGVMRIRGRFEPAALARLEREGAARV